MPATVTVTGVTGPGFALTAAVYTNVITFHVDANKNLLTLTKENVLGPIVISVNAATTVTATKSASTWTLTIS